VRLKPVAERFVKEKPLMSGICGIGVVERTVEKVDIGGSVHANVEK